MRPTFKSLRLLVNNPGPHNDSADILRRFPSLEQLARKSTKNSVKALKAGQDEVEFLRPYAPDISAWLTHFAQVPAYYDANGHWARVLPIFNAFSYDQSANQLNALSPAERQHRATARRQPLLSRRGHAAGARRLEPVHRRRQADRRRLRPEPEAGGPVRTS